MVISFVIIENIDGIDFKSWDITFGSFNFLFADAI